MGKKINPKLDESCHLSISMLLRHLRYQNEKNQVTKDHLFSPFTGTALTPVLYSSLRAVTPSKTKANPQSNGVGIAVVVSCGKITRRA